MSIQNNLRSYSWRKQANKQIKLPTSFPDCLPLPKYSVGDRCRWIPMPETDWGTIIGCVYVPDRSSNRSISQWVWVYLLLLDVESPSQRWTEIDWVDEEDLERLACRIPSSSFSGEEDL